MPLTGMRVLIVEGEAMLLLALQDMLSDLGCQCVASEGDLNCALQCTQDQDFDIAVLDIKASASALLLTRCSSRHPVCLRVRLLLGQHPATLCRPPASGETYRRDDLRAALLQALGKAHKEGPELRQ